MQNIRARPLGCCGYWLISLFSLFCLNKPLIPTISEKLYLLYPIVS